MATNISWCDEVWNPVVGCTHAGSKGCDNCYAKALHNKRHLAYIMGKWDAAPKQYHEPFSVVQCLPDRLDKPLHWRKPRTVFVNSVSDLFHEDVPDEFIQRVLEVIMDTPRHAYVVLTKRAVRMREFFEWRKEHFRVGLGDEYRELDNLYLGLSVSTQADVDRLMPDFLQVPGKKIISAEPLLEGLEIPEQYLMSCEGCGNNGSIAFDRKDRLCLDACVKRGETGSICGIIAGCESGPKRRHVDDDAFRNLRDQCSDAGVSFYLKQMEQGGKVVVEPELDGRQHLSLPWRLDQLIESKRGEGE
jgi:protein gp37